MFTRIYQNLSSALHSETTRARIIGEFTLKVCNSSSPVSRLSALRRVSERFLVMGAWGFYIEGQMFPSPEKTGPILIIQKSDKYSN